MVCDVIEKEMKLIKNDVQEGEEEEEEKGDKIILKCSFNTHSLFRLLFYWLNFFSRPRTHLKFLQS